MIRLIFVFIIFLGLIITSCKKSSFLDAKPDDGDVVLVTLTDYQAVLKNFTRMNQASPAFGQAASDDYFLIPGAFNTSALRTPGYKNIYTWDDDIYDIGRYDWDNAYVGIFYANIALDGIENMQVGHSEQDLFNNVKGSALFFRSNFLFELSQVFCPQYKQGVNIPYGLPLKLTSDINENLQRATLPETFDRIIGDLKLAMNLLPVIPTDTKNSPSRPAAYGLLAKVYLAMQKYDSSMKYANECLQLYNTLIDYNTLSASANFPIAQYNSEVIFRAVRVTTNINSLFSVSVCRVDSNLYNSYDNNDLRKSIYFKSETIGKSFKGGYDGSNSNFAGIATDEIYLVKAECNARLGNISEAMQDLNTLMQKRWRNTAWSPFTASDAADALNKILTERRKGLLFRGARWTDLRRLNSDGANIEVKRVVDGTTYTLPPNSLKYVYLIPPSVMQFHSDWLQNPR